MADFMKSLLVTVLLTVSLPWSESTSVSIVLSSADENVTTRSTVLLVCVAYGNPAPSITWKFIGGSTNSSIHNASSLRHTVYTSLSFSSGLNFTESILEICNIGINEGGQYICEASNDVDVVTNTTTLTVLESGEPNVPCNCSSKPVYSSGGDLSFIEFSWTQVDNPPAVIAGVDPNITDYHISVDGFGTHSIPAVSVCPPGSNPATNSNITCTYSYPVRSLNPQRESIDAYGHVAARNEIGVGRKCSPAQSGIGQMNSYMRTTLETTNGVVKIECLPSQDLSSRQSFECKFCYNSDSTCQSQNGGGNNWICSDVTSRTLSLSGLTTGTYCYRVTAVVDRSPTAVIQDTFIIHPQGNSLVSALSVSIPVSVITAFAVGLMVGCLTCLCYVCRYKCPRGESNDYVTATANKDAAGIYDVIPMDHTPAKAKGKEMDIVTNSAYGKLPAPKW